MTVLDFTLSLLSVGGDTAWRQAWRVRRTLAWVERRCREDGHGEEIVRLVVRNFEMLYTRDPWAVTLPDDNESGKAS